MRVARLFLLLGVGALGCFGSTRPCRSLLLPSASAFERCGGILYHAPPGSSDAYTIRFVNNASSDFELTDVCVLLDGAPIWSDSEIKEYLPRAAKHPAVWKGKIANVRHTVEVQITYKPKAPFEGEDITKTYTVFVRAAQEIAATDDGELELTVTERGDSKSPPNERLAIAATTPARAQPRCE